MTTESSPSFAELGLNPEIVSVLDSLGYEAPTPIQQQSIPVLLEGHDLLGQAQTGTGKTGAFALPLITKVDLKVRNPQVLVLCPTRELAIQVAEAFQTYARGYKGFHVLPIYGGQSMQFQLRQLQRGVHVIVGTPGRVIDHLKRGSLTLESIKAVVLDEADEMLKMGFIDDIEWILQQSPEEKQTALFSATMPAPIRRVANNYLKNCREIKIHTKTSTVETIRQCYWNVSGLHKLDALTRLLELEPIDAALIFVRTKTATVELVEKLEARGHSCAALNGDLNQALRERTIDRVKKGDLNVLIATDVAARGLDVERISHVINYDIPYDTASYVHRIGRTGRAGRQGTAILFVSMREQRMLRAIEQATRQKMELLKLPSKEDVYQHRIQRFSNTLTEILEKQDLTMYRDVMDRITAERACEPNDLLAALCYLAQKDAPFVSEESRESKESDAGNRDARRGSDRRFESSHERNPRERNRRDSRELRESRGPRPTDVDLVTYRLEVGRDHGATPANIVGTITRVANLRGDTIGYIKLHDDHSTVQLPDGMPDEVFKKLERTEINGAELRLTLAEREASRHDGRDDVLPIDAGKKRKDRPRFDEKRAAGEAFPRKDRPKKAHGGKDFSSKRPFDKKRSDQPAKHKSAGRRPGPATDQRARGKDRKRANG